jgi:hypothetical protein
MISAGLIRLPPAAPCCMPPRWSQIASSTKPPPAVMIQVTSAAHSIDPLPPWGLGSIHRSPVFTPSVSWDSRRGRAGAVSLTRARCLDSHLQRLYELYVASIANACNSAQKRRLKSVSASCSSFRFAQWDPSVTSAPARSIPARSTDAGFSGRMRRCARLQRRRHGLSSGLTIHRLAGRRGVLRPGQGEGSRAAGGRRALASQ